MLIRFEDICDQIQKLLKIALNFGRFYLPNFVGGTPCKISVHVITQSVRPSDKTVEVKTV